MFAVGMDVDTIVFTELPCKNLTVEKLSQEYFYLEWEKILLCAGNFCTNSPLAFIAFGKSYLKKKISPEQSAGNFSISTKAPASTKNTYNLHSSLSLQGAQRSSQLRTHTTNQSQLHHYFITGFVDAEGCFFVRVQPRKDLKTG